MTTISGNGWPLMCSACGEPLTEQSGAMRCLQGHSFDIAKDGYVNLLTSKDAERGIGGDTRAMLHARRRFLESGHFQPLLDGLRTEVGAALAGHTLSQTTATCVLEVGCGDGYYIGNMAAAVPSHSATIVRYVGLDVAKDAARLAARRYKWAQFAVANARRRLYVTSGSVGALLSVFAPRNEPEFRRVLAPGGALIIAIPGSQHMESLRDTYGLLHVEDAKEERIHDQFGEHFVLAKRHVIKYPIILTPEQGRDFIGMGPNARHVNAEAMSFPRPIETLASFVILCFYRRGAEGIRLASG